MTFPSTKDQVADKELEPIEICGFSRRKVPCNFPSLAAISLSLSSNSYDIELKTPGFFYSSTTCLFHHVILLGWSTRALSEHSDILKLIKST